MQILTVFYRHQCGHGSRRQVQLGNGGFGIGEEAVFEPGVDPRPGDHFSPQGRADGVHNLFLAAQLIASDNAFFNQQGLNGANALFVHAHFMGVFNRGMGIVVVRMVVVIIVHRT